MRATATQIKSLGTLLLEACYQDFPPRTYLWQRPSSTCYATSTLFPKLNYHCGEQRMLSRPILIKL